MRSDDTLRGVGLQVLLRLFFLLSQLFFASGFWTVRLAGWGTVNRPADEAEARSVIVIQAYNDRLAGVRADNQMST